LTFYFEGKKFEEQRQQNTKDIKNQSYGKLKINNRKSFLPGIGLISRNVQNFGLTFATFSFNP
jgi:hypothetical protein